MSYRQVAAIALLAVSVGTVVLLMPWPSEGLIAHYPLDGNAKDNTRINRPGVVVSARPTRDRFGEPAAALSFDGVDDYINLGNAGETLSKLDQGTISLWFKVDSLPVKDTHILLQVGNRLGTRRVNMLQIELGHYRPGVEVQADDSIYYTTLRNGQVQLCFDSNTQAIQPGVWHHYVVVIGADYNRGYLNGSLMVERRFNGPPDSSHPQASVFFSRVARSRSSFTLGKGNMSSFEEDFFFHGALDDLRIYDRPLSDEEISEIFSDSGASQSFFSQIF